jgi:hypothetical protein
LLSRNLEKRKQLVNALAEDVPNYNTIRPQFSIEGNTPAETFAGKITDLKSYNTHFNHQKALRITQNQKNRCKGCK